MSINQQLRHSQRYFAYIEMPDAVGIVAAQMIGDHVHKAMPCFTPELVKSGIATFELQAGQRFVPQVATLPSHAT